MALPPEKERRESSDQLSRVVGSSPAPSGGRSLGLYPGWDSLLRIRDEFDRMFDQFFRNLSGSLEGAGSEYRWSLDMQENDGNIVIRAEAPGFEPSDFDLEVRGDQLILRASRKTETQEEERGYQEWQQQEFYRLVSLPQGIDVDRVNASYRNGVLTVTLPKTEEGKGRRIAVQS